MNYLKKTDINKAILFFDQIIFSSISFLLTLFFARNYSAEILGGYNLYIISFQFTQAILDNTFLTPAQSYFPNKNKKNLAAKNISYLFLPYILFSFLISLICAIFFIIPSLKSSNLNFENFGYLRLLPLIFILSQTSYLFMRRSVYILSGFKELLYTSIARLFLVLSVIFIALKYTYLGLPFIILFLSFSNLFISFLLIKKLGLFRNIPYQFCTSSFYIRTLVLLKRLSKTARWLLPTGILQAISGELIFLIALQFLNLEKLGQLRAVLACTMVIKLFFQVLDQYVLVSISKILKSKGSFYATKYTKRVQIKVLSITGSVFILGIFLAPKILFTFYGPDFIELSNLLRLALIGPILEGLISPRNSLLICLKRSNYIFISYVSICVLYLIFILPFIYFLDLYGFLIMLLAGQLLRLMILYLPKKKLT